MLETLKYREFSEIRFMNTYNCVCLTVLAYV